MALAKPNVYILEGGINHWLNIYGVVDDEARRSRHRQPGRAGRHPAASVQAGAGRPARGGTPG